MVIQLGIEEGFFEYNTPLKAVYPIWAKIDSGEFMEILAQKDSEYNDLLTSFGQYLQDKYNFHYSKEALSDQVQSFIQRYGLVSKTDGSVFERVKNDYLFAEYMLHCNEIGDSSTLAYIDEYTTGCAFAEVMTFSVPTNKYKNCCARVFLDTGFIFALLGIGSKDRSKVFETLRQDMVHLGMKPTIFQHTYSEIAGIIDTARSWIGNDNYEPALASETAYYFVTNNWSYQKATDLLGDLKRILTEDFQIAIDDTPYPHIEDIHTKYEQNIKNAIIEEYICGNARFSTEDKEYTINQDARSLFMTLHFDGGYVAHTIPDVKNIFITTNRTLAKVGKKLTSEIAHGSESYIPIVLTDLAWGTLIWANSPAKISSLNRANIISAAYAAFKPSEEILQRLNKTLLRCQESGEISPEKCYFLKTNSVALKILSQKTMNDEARYSEQMPFEILRELRKEGFEEGLLEKQKEVDQLVREKETVDFELSLAKQTNIVDGLKKDREAKAKEIAGKLREKDLLEQRIASLNTTKASADNKIQSRLKCFKGFAVLIVLIYIAVVIIIAKSVKYSWAIGAIGLVIPAIISIMRLCQKAPVTPVAILEQRRDRITKAIYFEYNFVPEDYDNLRVALADVKSQICRLENELHSISARLKEESAKIDSHSVDISLIEH